MMRTRIAPAAAILVVAMFMSSARAQANSLTIPSTGDADVSAPANREPDAQIKSKKIAANDADQHANKKKKKHSFMNKMRDKATEQLQKLLGSKQDQEPAAATR